MYVQGGVGAIEAPEGTKQLQAAERRVQELGEQLAQQNRQLHEALESLTGSREAEARADELAGHHPNPDSTITIFSVCPELPPASILRATNVVECRSGAHARCCRCIVDSCAGKEALPWGGLLHQVMQLPACPSIAAKGEGHPAGMNCSHSMSSIGS